jgi:hypothetical protein
LDRWRFARLEGQRKIAPSESSCKGELVSFAGLLRVNRELINRGVQRRERVDWNLAGRSSWDESSAAISRRAAAIFGSEVDLAYLSSVAA